MGQAEAALRLSNALLALQLSLLLDFDSCPNRVLGTITSRVERWLPIPKKHLSGEVMELYFDQFAIGIGSKFSEIQGA